MSRQPMSPIRAVSRMFTVVGVLTFVAVLLAAALPAQAQARVEGLREGRIADVIKVSRAAKRSTSPSISLAFTSVPAATVATSSAAIGWNVKGAAHVWCSLDEGTAGRCVSPQRYSNLTLGSHSFVVSAWTGKSQVSIKTTWTIGAPSISAPAPVASPTVTSPPPPATPAAPVISAAPTATTTATSASTSTFGASLPVAPAPPTGLIERTASNWAELSSAVALGNVRVRVIGSIQIPIDWRWSKPNVWVYGDPTTGGTLYGGHIKINTTDVWIENLTIRDGPYDGIKIGDGAAASRIVIRGNHIYNVGDQGILFGSYGGTNVWLERNLIDHVNLTENPTVSADGHGIYTGGYSGVTHHVYILANEIHPAGFGIQLYPEPHDVIVSGNSIIGGDTRGGMVMYTGYNVRFVGNLIADAPSAAFEISAGAASSTGVNASDNLAFRCPLWTPGFAVPPGTGNISTTDTAVASARRVSPANETWLPPFTRTGVRTGATIGS